MYVCARVVSCVSVSAFRALCVALNYLVPVCVSQVYIVCIHLFNGGKRRNEERDDDSGND